MVARSAGGGFGRLPDADGSRSECLFRVETVRLRYPDSGRSQNWIAAVRYDSAITDQTSLFGMAGINLRRSFLLTEVFGSRQGGATNLWQRETASGKTTGSGG